MKEIRLLKSVESSLSENMTFCYYPLWELILSKDENKEIYMTITFMDT